MDIVEEADVCEAPRVNSLRIGVVDIRADLRVMELAREVVGGGDELESRLRPWRWRRRTEGEKKKRGEHGGGWEGEGERS